MLMRRTITLFVIARIRKYDGQSAAYGAKKQMRLLQCSISWYSIRLRGFSSSSFGIPSSSRWRLKTPPAFFRRYAQVRHQAAQAAPFPGPASIADSVKSRLPTPITASAGAAQKGPVKTPKRIAPLVDEGMVDEVVRQLMSGKEAEVYVVRCGQEVRCAKVYKEASKRSFRQSVQ